MGGQSHNTMEQRHKQLDIGRPPGIPSRQCSGWVVEYDRQCAAGAAWAVPEVAFCAHHMPMELLPVMLERMQRWHVDGAWLFATICAEVQAP
jgi:hypothetical protein